jgi:phage gpG-like protein
VAIALTIEVKNPASPAMRRMLAQLQDRTIPNRQVGIELFRWVERNFQAEGALGGGWVPLKPETVAQKARGGWSPKPLIRTGNLRDSFAGFGDAEQAGVGAQASFGVDYARVHQEGNPARNLPARPMLPPPEIAKELWSRVYDNFIETLIHKEGLR